MQEQLWPSREESAAMNLRRAIAWSSGSSAARRGTLSSFDEAASYTENRVSRSRSSSRALIEMRFESSLSA